MHKSVLPLFAGLVLVLASCGLAPVAPTQAPPEVDVPPEMVLIPAGTFEMGTDQGLPFEGPVHTVQVDAFLIDRYEVTNRQYQEFVEASGHVTESEKLGWSGVFDVQEGAWKPVDGADWRHPEGPGSSITERLGHPVVHVSWEDARAYAEWSGKSLPTEAQWEWAARGGLTESVYSWGNELQPEGSHMANVWQGTFPLKDQGEDGFQAPAPVGTFPANGYGLYDIAGNVWEWTEDWFSPNTYRENGPSRNPRGPTSGQEKVIRGGSWMCSENYCTGYRVGARQKTPTDSGLNNLGFRCVRGVGDSVDG